MNHAVLIASCVCAMSFFMGAMLFAANKRDSERIACTQAMTEKHPERSTDDILKLCGIKA